MMQSHGYILSLIACMIIELFGIAVSFQPQLTTNHNYKIPSWAMPSVALKRSSSLRNSVQDSLDDANDDGNDGVQRRRFLRQCCAIMTAPMLAPKPANAYGLVQFPCRRPLLNTYHAMAAGQNLLEEEDILATNPLFLTNREAALSPKGIAQVAEACKFLEQNNVNPSVMKYSLAASSMDTTTMIKEALKVGQNRIIPEFTFMDPRGIGQWDSMSMAQTLPAIYALDEAEAGKDGKFGRPPPTDDGTPNETLKEQSIRLVQLMSVLETQFQGDTVLLVFPDGSTPALLSCMMAGIPYSKVHELEFAPGEVRLDLHMTSVQEYYSERKEHLDLTEEYQRKVQAGKVELERLRGLDPEQIVTKNDIRMERERSEIDAQQRQRDEQKRLREEQAQQARLLRQKELEEAKERERQAYIKKKEEAEQARASREQEAREQDIKTRIKKEEQASQKQEQAKQAYLRNKEKEEHDRIKKQEFAQQALNKQKVDAEQVRIKRQYAQEAALAKRQKEGELQQMAQTSEVQSPSESESLDITTQIAIGGVAGVAILSALTMGQDDEDSDEELVAVPSASVAIRNETLVAPPSETIRVIEANSMSANETISIEIAETTAPTTTSSEGTSETLPQVSLPVGDAQSQSHKSDSEMQSESHKAPSEELETEPSRNEETIENAIPEVLPEPTLPLDSTEMQIESDATSPEELETEPSRNEETIENAISEVATLPLDSTEMQSESHAASSEELETEPSTNEETIENAISEVATLPLDSTEMQSESHAAPSEELETEPSTNEETIENAMPEVLPEATLPLDSTEIQSQSHTASSEESENESLTHQETKGNAMPEALPKVTLPLNDVMSSNRKSLYSDAVPTIDKKKKVAFDAMQEYMDQDDGADDWLTVMSQIVEEEEEEVERDLESINIWE